MPFKYDIFISYAHLDDRSVLDGDKGWIGLLEERLSVLVSQALGSEVSIWRDGHNLQGNDELQGAIGEGVANSLVLVPVMSPRYVQSQWCKTEMASFCTNLPPAGAGAPNYRSRIFKLAKTPLPDHLKKFEPEQIRNLIGYRFYDEDETEFSSDPKDKAYWKTLSRLVSDISKKLIELKYSAAVGQADDAVTAASSTDAATHAVADEHGSDRISVNGKDGPRLVYLAESTSDLTSERELVRDELQQRGHVVLPEQQLPREEAKRTEAAVRADLVRCSLSVHLVGTRYGSTPEDDARSIVRIQEQLATDRGQEDPNFIRLLWMPPGLGTLALEISDERQKSFIAELQTRVTSGAELLQTSVEDLKTRIIEKLNPPATPARDTRPSRVKQVYLICENRDRPLVRPLKEYLFNQKFEVITWRDEGTAGKLMEYHHKNLRECDAALIYFGNGDEPWVRKNLEDLDKAYGYGREADWLANAVYVGAPPNEEKEDFLTHLVPYVIRNFKSFDPNDLRDFVSAVKSAQGGLQ